MKLSVDFVRWTTTKAAVAVAGALVIGGAVGSALAISPTVAPPIKWQGGFEALLNVPFNGGVGTPAYVVPAGKSLIITDVLAANTNVNTGAFLRMFSASGSCSSPIADRMKWLSVGPSSSESLSFQAGIGFPSGQTVCLIAGSTLSVNLRGFLFTAAPVS